MCPPGHRLLAPPTPFGAIFSTKSSLFLTVHVFDVLFEAETTIQLNHCLINGNIPAKEEWARLLTVMASSRGQTFNKGSYSGCPSVTAVELSFRWKYWLSFWNQPLLITSAMAETWRRGSVDQYMDVSGIQWIPNINWMKMNNFTSAAAVSFQVLSGPLFCCLCSAYTFVWCATSVQNVSGNRKQKYSYGVAPTGRVWSTPTLTIPSSTLNNSVEISVGLISFDYFMKSKAFNIFSSTIVTISYHWPPILPCSVVRLFFVQKIASKCSVFTRITEI